MRRELKAALGIMSGSVCWRFSSCPDEGGTERRHKAPLDLREAIVSAVVPMRRELKGLIASRRGGHFISRFSSCPDEEGTERFLRQQFPPVPLSVSAVVPMRRELKAV